MPVPQLTFDQWLQVLNVLGTWVAGLATFAAVVVSLWLARQQGRVRLKVIAAVMFVFNRDGTKHLECIGYRVINLGDRAVTINTIGWAVGKGKAKRFAAIDTDDRLGAIPPKRLEQGESTVFMVELDPGLLPHMREHFVKDAPLSSLVSWASTASGVSVEAKPSRELIDRLAALPATPPTPPT